MGRTTGHRSCSSLAWQHAPQVLYEIAVDGGVTLIVNVRLYGGVDDKRLQSGLVDKSVSRYASAGLDTERALRLSRLILLAAV